MLLQSYGQFCLVYSFYLFYHLNLLLRYLAVFLGIGANEWSTADGLITKADESITKIVHQVSSIVGGQTHGVEDFIQSMTLVFFVILIVLCLPAFNRD
jgi:hypothetical protein